MAKSTKLRMGAKTAFVREHPDVPPKDLLALAEKQGIPLTVGYIYNIRASTKAKGGQVAAPGRRARGAGPVGGGSGLDVQLRTLIIRVGLDRAEQVFAQLKKSLS